jgi:hypothetical protein
METLFQAVAVGIQVTPVDLGLISQWLDLNAFQHAGVQRLHPLRTVPKTAWFMGCHEAGVRLSSSCFEFRGHEVSKPEAWHG